MRNSAFFMLVVVAVALGSCIGADLARSAPSLDIVEKMYDKAYNRYVKDHPGFVKPEHLPNISIVPQSVLQEEGCTDSDPHCNALGTFGFGELHLCDCLENNKYTESIIFHELLHYFQSVQSGHGVAENCQEYKDMEIEAYKDQLELMVEERFPYSFLMGQQRELMGFINMKCD